MKIDALATVPTAFLTGLVGTLAYDAFWAWLYSGDAEPTRAAELAVYAAFVVVPFLLFVIGLDRKRWDPDYDWFGDAAKADGRRILIRFGVYWVGVFIAYAV